jgi:hypothetical protein
VHSEEPVNLLLVKLPHPITSTDSALNILEILEMGTFQMEAKEDDPYQVEVAIALPGATKGPAYLYQTQVDLTWRVMRPVATPAAGAP